MCGVTLRFPQELGPRPLGLKAVGRLGFLLGGAQGLLCWWQLQETGWVAGWWRGPFSSCGLLREGGTQQFNRLLPSLF